MERRAWTLVVTAALAGVLGGGLGPGAVPAGAHLDGLHDEGVGTYTDPSVANQISNFTINREMVSCGVGTVTAAGTSGPFAMLMYATNINSYHVDRKDGVITAAGTMRSITQTGGATAENVLHEFLAVAVDGPDRFDVHFTTPFWNTGNPMCTSSGRVTGGCRFGGRVLPDLGEIVAG